ncbi:MAG: malate synthase A, partial [Chloroflexota bacterium]|nr:malate synthase A [Chloroflexota bacterium]
LEVLAPVPPEYMEILSPDALAFVAMLSLDFGSRRQELLRRRETQQAELDAGSLLDFLPETGHIRRGDWTVAPLPADLQDRRVEITGPTDRKMVINALNSGARMYMADFEDANAPTWANLVEGQINLRDAVSRTIEYDSPDGRRYRLNPTVATLLVRPRGWHLPEKHVLVDGAPVPGALFEFGLYLYHNVRTLLEMGTGPYFYLPKLESHLEARLWNDVFVRAQAELGIPRGTIRATVLIETLPAAFEMDEILYELREHSAGLNCGRWDYIFSYIKKLRNHPDRILPDRAQVTMTVPFMRSYSLLVIRTCHRRNAPAMGGMAAQIPIRSDQAANEEAFRKVREDKVREAGDGHDGTWVAHPGLVQVATEAFDAVMQGPNQIARQRDDVQVTAEDLLRPSEGEITETGLRTNLSVGVQYLEAWLRGNGAVPINNLMEDAATAEICRAQVWQWIHNPGGVLSDGRRVTMELCRELMAQELEKVRAALGEERYTAGRFDVASELFDRLTTGDTFVEFLTLPGYDYLD